MQPAAEYTRDLVVIALSVGEKQTAHYLTSSSSCYGSSCSNKSSNSNNSSKFVRFHGYVRALLLVSFCFLFISPVRGGRLWPSGTRRFAPSAAATRTTRAHALSVPHCRASCPGCSRFFFEFHQIRPAPNQRDLFVLLVTIQGLELDVGGQVETLGAGRSVVEQQQGMQCPIGWNSAIEG